MGHDHPRRGSVLQFHVTATGGKKARQNDGDGAGEKESGKEIVRREIVIE